MHCCNIACPKCLVAIASDESVPRHKDASRSYLFVCLRKAASGSAIRVRLQLFCLPRQLWVRQSEALATAVRRGVHAPLTPSWSLPKNATCHYGLTRCADARSLSHGAGRGQRQRMLGTTLLQEGDTLGIMGCGIEHIPFFFYASESRERSPCGRSHIQGTPMDRCVKLHERSLVASASMQGSLTQSCNVVHSKYTMQYMSTTM